MSKEFYECHWHSIARRRNGNALHPLEGGLLGVKEKGVKRLLGQIEQYEESILCFAGGTDAVSM